METKEDYFEDLKTIRKIMEESSRFLSLSGLSGIFAGIVALAGGFLAFTLFRSNNLLENGAVFRTMMPGDISAIKAGLFADAFAVLLVAIGAALFFSYRKARKQGVKIWTPVSKRLLMSLLVPLATGGILIVIFFFRGTWQMIIPSMLIFYGLALVSSGKFTYNEVFYLGLVEIVTGLASAARPEYGILFWCFGFGILHLAYGILMYRRYQ